ncbi:class I SAM-dependent methyltransferase [Marinobacter confluentis]|uniref:Class I SAM-dependent methyltransferase n=1 Tax=Marinobacter confluentis TaxID=1697557 RepID=A0A4Z1C7J5_9GAMM|nr:class I SAM-dependent methyltransferase [Marinobacter confluentis]TGN41610.1 class I SAM-dependent methyltransferase [Marinobacter confluentis]
MGQAAEIDYTARHQSFEDWFQTPLGRSLLADQRAQVDRLAGKLTGARQLHVALSHRLPLATGTDFSQRILTTPTWQDDMPDGVAVSDADELPFPGDSMDLVILHHTADFSPYPHQALREASRVLRGEGSILLIGFNPVGLWGLRRLVSRHGAGPWGGRFLLKSRMEDWLRLLDFTIESTDSCFFRTPLQSAAFNESRGLVERFCANRLLPLGAYYCILAKKRVYSRLPRKPAWRSQKVIPIPARGAVGASRGYSGKGYPED